MKSRIIMSYIEPIEGEENKFRRWTIFSNGQTRKEIIRRVDKK